MYSYIVNIDTEKALFAGEKRENRTVVTHQDEYVVEDEQARQGSRGLRYNETDGFYTVAVPPKSDEAHDKLAQLLVNSYKNNNSSSPELDAVEMLDKYPSVARYIDKGDYQFVVDYIREKVQASEGIVTDSMVNEFASYLLVE